MLNELLALERGLKAANVPFEPRHPDIKTCAKSDVIRVRLKADGGVGAVDFLLRDDRRDLWTRREGQKNSFPGVKLGFGDGKKKTGILQLTEAERNTHNESWKNAKTPAKKRSELLRLLTGAVVSQAETWPEYRGKVSGLLSVFQHLETDPKTAAIPAVIQRFLIATESPCRLFTCIVNLFRSEVENGGDECLLPIHDALIGESLLYFDIDHGNDDHRDVADSRQIPFLTSSLTNHSNTQLILGECTLTGMPGLLLSGNPPEPNLPGIGQTKVFSKNDEIPATIRYGRSGATSIPLGLETACRLNGALLACTRKDHEGKTWRLLATGKRHTDEEEGNGEGSERETKRDGPEKESSYRKRRRSPDLFIAFIASASGDRVADALAGEDSQDASEEDEDDEGTYGVAEFNQASSRLVGFWKGIADRAPPGELARLIILSKVDRGNHKALFDRSPTVQALHAAAIDWTVAMTSAPDWISFTPWKDRKPVQGHPRVQSPLSLVWLSRKLYIRGGNEIADAPGVSGSEALALFLDEGDRAWRARRILRLLLNRHTGLLVGTIQATRRGEFANPECKTTGLMTTTRTDARRSVAWIAALLWFSTSKTKAKGTYMNDAPFKLGQLLALADTLHIGYCADQRGGDVPPSLLGASVFSAAGRRPTRALESLQQRVGPYIAWVRRDEEARNRASSLLHAKQAASEVDVEHVTSANTRASPVARASTSPEVRSSRITEALDAYSRWARIACDLHSQLDGTPTNDLFRAELLLGYVAGIKPKAKLTRTGLEEEVAA